MSVAVLLLLGLIRAHDFDGALGNESSNGSRSSEPGGKQCSYDTNRQWHFNDGMFSLPDDDAAHIALVNQVLYFVGQIATLHMYLFSVFWFWSGIRIVLGHACSLFLSAISCDDDVLLEAPNVSILIEYTLNMRRSKVTPLSK